jgi:hypothetical protein
MKKSSKFLAGLCLLAFCGPNCLHAQERTDHSGWKKYAFLVGNWIGEGNGQPGQGKGSFSIEPDLNGRVLVRKNHSEYPATAQRPALTHDDLMIIYGDHPGELSSAIYVDNEDHTIHYSISFSEDGKTITFISAVLASSPTFRLSYTQLDADMLDLKFEIAPPGKPDVFSTYVEGKVHRVRS